MKKKKLQLSKNKMLGGVIAGFAEYTGLDMTLLRVLFAFFVIITGFFPGVFGYIVAWFIMFGQTNNSGTINVEAKRK